jgi:osmotically-inducible protein OsmY
MSARSAIDARYTAILQTVGLNLNDLETMPVMTLKDRIATIDSSWRVELMKERKRIGQRKAQQRVRERREAEERALEARIENSNLRRYDLEADLAITVEHYNQGKQKYEEWLNEQRNNAGHRLEDLNRMIDEQHRTHPY